MKGIENFKVENIKLWKWDALELIKTVPDASVDVICIDPPYLYLKNQRLERVFNEELFFSECYRILKPNGFVIMFGRGSSFYRWNTMIDQIGFKFLEEIIWNKSQCSSPLLPLSRVHETISIHTKGKGKILKNKVPYLEMKGHDIDGVIQDIKRIKSILKNTKSLNAVLSYLENNERDVSDSWKANNLSISSEITKEDRSVSVIRSLRTGMNEKSIIDGDLRKHKNSATVQPCILINEDRSSAVVRIIDEGMNEKSIIKQVRDHYTSIHPTQKPVRLIERLLLTVLKPYTEGERHKVMDFFGGSFATVEAAINLGFDVEACEIDDIYFNDGKDRIIKKLGIIIPVTEFSNLDF